MEDEQINEILYGAMPDLLTCTHQNTKIVEKIYPDPIGIENVQVCSDCGKEI